jgi:hypothetical protein
MKYRRLSDSGDYSFGHGDSDFAYDLEASVQAVKTRLQLYKDSFWRDLNDGLPMYQSILASSGAADNLTVVDSVLKKRILGTEGVSRIVNFDSQFDPNSRRYSFTCVIDTIYTQNVVIEDSF